MSSHFSYWPKNSSPRATAKNLVKVFSDFFSFSPISHKDYQIASEISPLQLPTKTSPKDNAA